MLSALHSHVSSRASASADATMATWGGSTVDNLENITEDEDGQDGGNRPEDDDDGEGRCGCKDSCPCSHSSCSVISSAAVVQLVSPPLPQHPLPAIPAAC